MRRYKMILFCRTSCSTILLALLNLAFASPLSALTVSNTQNTPRGKIPSVVRLNAPESGVTVTWPKPPDSSSDLYGNSWNGLDLNLPDALQNADPQNTSQPAWAGDTSGNVTSWQSAKNGTTELGEDTLNLNNNPPDATENIYQGTVTGGSNSKIAVNNAASLTFDGAKIGSQTNIDKPNTDNQPAEIGTLSVGSAGNQNATVTLRNGTEGNFNNVVVSGNGDSGNNTLNVSNSILNTGNTTIGDQGTGTLNLQNNAQANISGNLTLGGEKSGTGNVTVNNSILNMTGDTNTSVIIGDQGTGTLTATNSTINEYQENNADSASSEYGNAKVILGNQAGSYGKADLTDSRMLVQNNRLIIGEAGTGEMTVSGSNAQLYTKNGNNFYGLIVGDAAGSSGSLTFKNGANYTAWSNDMVIGNDGTGTVTFQGQGTTGNFGLWSINIGNSDGTGTLNVTDGATVGQVAKIYIGNEDSDTASGTLNVLNGSALTANKIYTDAGDQNAIHIENSTVTLEAVASGDPKSRSPTLTLNGGNMSMTNNARLIFNTTDTQNGTPAPSGMVSRLDISSGGRASNATLTLDGKSRIEMLGGIATVGAAQGTTGTFTLKGGSALFADSLILGTNQGTGNLTVDGQESSVKLSGQAVIGDGDQGTGTATVSNGGSLSANNLILGNNQGTGTLNVDGKGSKVSLGNQVVIGNHGQGTATFSNGASLFADSLILGTSQGKGELNIKGNGSTLTVAHQTIIGDAGKGTLNVTGKGSQFTSNNVTLALKRGSVGALNVAEGAIFNAQGFIMQGFGSASMSLTNASLNATGNLYDDVKTNLSGQNTINTNENNVYLNSKLSGDGGFDKTGSGILQINNKENNYTGTTNIKQGVLEGVGTIGGDLNIGNGAVLRAGISSNPAIPYGKMQVNGNTFMQNGSRMEANLGIFPAASGVNDKGSFTIGSNTTLKVVVAEGAQLKVNQAYNIVHADNGVVGKFTHYEQDGKIGSDASDGYAVLQTDYGHPAYSKNDVDITLTYNNRSLGWGGDRNQTSTGNALTPSLYNSTALSQVAEALAGNTNAQRLYNLTQMDGEIASDMRTGNIDSNFWIRDSVNNRLDCLEDTFRQIGNGQATTSNVCGVTGKKVNVWGNMYGSLGGQNGHSGWDYAVSTKENNAGFIWGVDGEVGADGYAEDRWHIGMMMGYGSVMENAGGVSSSGESNNANIGMYFGKQVRFDNQNFFTFHSQFGYTWNIMSWHRSLNLQGATAAYNQTLHAHELGGTAHINAEIAYKHVFNLWGTPLELAPTGSITYLNYEQGSYHETGGNLALHGAATNTNLGYGFMGAKLATNFDVGSWVITPHGKFGYRRSFGANQSYTHAGFEALGGTTDMTIVGVPVVQDQALTELGFDVHPTEFFSFGANYAGLYGGHSQTMSGGQLTAKIAF